MAKTALCVGINDYPGTGSDLSGCVNDARDWKDTLEGRGYSVTLLLDKEATAKNMTAALRTLVGGAQKGDSIVFTFSGHGSWQPDEGNDEADARDEMLCPYDIMDGGRLLDDTLNEIFQEKVPGVSFYFISDSCHSGSVSRLAPPLPGAVPAPRARFLPPQVFIKDPGKLREVRALALVPGSSKEKYPALLFSGCMDQEFSYDANFNNRPNGAFTYIAREALKKGPKTPDEWFREIRRSLPSVDYRQTPQLYGSKKAKAGAML